MDVINFAEVILSGTQRQELGPASTANLKVHMATISVTYGLASQGKYSLDMNLLLSRFKKGAKETLPSKPPTTYNWTLAQLFNFIHDTLGMSDLPDSQLRLKTLLLLRVDTCCRSDDLTGLFRENIAFSDAVNDKPRQLQLRFFRTKETGMLGTDWTDIVTVRSPDPIFAASDTVTTVQDYMSRTAMQASQCEFKIDIGGTTFTPFFLSLNSQGRGPGKFAPITAQRLAALAKHTLKDIGVDGNEDGPHSIRGVSAAHEYAVTKDMDAVVRRGRWASPATFTEYYNKNFTAGAPVTYLAPHLLDNTANILRGSCKIAYQQSSGWTRGDVPGPLGSTGVVGLDRTIVTSRGQEPPAHEQGSDRPLSQRLAVGDIVVFPLGLFEDAPDRRVRGLVLEKCRTEWRLQAQCDKTTLHVPKALMAEMLSSGTAHVIGSWSH